VTPANGQLSPAADGRFRAFELSLNELRLAVATHIDGESQAERVPRSLFADFYPNQTFEQRSYSVRLVRRKHSRQIPPSDIDMILVITDGDSPGFNNRSGNKQSKRRPLLKP
jgi:hypothetical protein